MTIYSRSAEAAALLALILPACTPQPAPNGPPNSAQEHYTARGQEPGWTLTIANGRMEYVGDYGATQIDVPRPEPITAINGHVYRTERLIVSTSHGRCNDAMSGQGYADSVQVIADGKTVKGCGGERRPDWDM